MSSYIQGNTLIEEFDAEVQTRIEMMKKNAENTAENMRNALDLILTSLPTCIRQMPMKALIMNFGGDIQKATAYFTPSSSSRGTPRTKPVPRSTRKQARKCLSQTLSISDLLKQKAACEAQAAMRSPNQNRSPNVRPPPKRQTSPRNTAKSPSRTLRPGTSRMSPRK